MNRDEIKEAVINSVAFINGIDKKEVSESEQFFEYCIDWYDFMELLMDIESKNNFNINEKDKDEYSFENLKEFIDYVYENHSKG